MKEQINVIVIGADHHNTLAVVRCLGREKCDLKILIHCHQVQHQKIKLQSSKYAKNRVYCVEEEENIVVQWLSQQEAEKHTILFPCSDFAAYVIDKNYDVLREKYVLSGFEDRPGLVVKYMDKWEQSKLAHAYNLPMANTWKLDLKENGLLIPEDIWYPCIIKPEISACGRKSDIKICKTNEEVNKHIDDLLSLGYETVILQEFIKKEYEVCAYGCLLKREKNKDAELVTYGGVIKKIREWPIQGGGSLTYAMFIDNEQVNVLLKRVLGILNQEGYFGQYDIEFFVCHDKVFLNEINFRHSGNGYALIQNKVKAPYIGCLNLLGYDIPKKFKKNVKSGKRHMDELSDALQVKHHYISVMQWLVDIFRTSAFAKFAISDMAGTMVYYRSYIFSAFKRIFRAKKVDE